MSDNAIAADVKPPDPMGTLATILGIQQRKQALVSGQLDIERQQAGLVGQQQQAKETQAGAQLLADPVGNGITDKDGNVMSNAHVKILQAMPTTGSEKYDQLVKAATGNVQYKNAWLKLRSDVRQDVSARLQGAAVDPNSGMPEIHDTLNTIKSDYSGTPAADDVNKIVGISKGAIDDAAGSHGLPGAKSVINHFSTGGLANTQLSGPGGLGTPQAAQIDTGGQIQPGTVAPPLQGGGFTPGGAPINKVTPPALTTNANQQLVSVAPGGAGASVVPGQPNANPTAATAIAQRGQAEAVTGRVSQALAQANNTVQAQDALSRAKAILESPSSPKTGANFESFKTLKNTLSSLGIDTQGADDMNTLAKNLARFEAARATASGLGGTDAARELAHAGSPNTQIDNKAALGIVNQSLASEKALASYAKVQSKTNDPQALLKNESDFRNIPHLIEAHEYGMSRNKEEADAYLHAHGISREQMKASRDAVKEFDSR